jgi:hypothetical protein
MKIRKTISLDSDDVKTLKPFLESSGNNLSLALRKLIESYKQQTSVKSITGDQQKKMMLRSQIIDNRIAELIPVPLMKWMLNMSIGIPPLGTFRSIIEKFPKMLGIENISLAEYLRMINIYSDIFGLQIRQHVEYDPEFKKIKIFYESEDPSILKSAMVTYSCLLAHNPFRLKLKKLIDSPNLTIIEYEQCNSEEEAYRSIKDYFGYKSLMLEEIQNNISFWNALVKIIKADNYENVIMNREILVNLSQSHEFSYQLKNLILFVYGLSAEEADFRHITRIIEEIFVTCGFLLKIENNDVELKIFHKFDDEKIINTLNETIIKTFGISCQQFKIKKSGKITILNRTTT